MTRNVEVTVNIDVARRMLRVAGIQSVNLMEDDEIFEKAIKMNAEYGVTSVIQELQQGDRKCE